MLARGGLGFDGAELGQPELAHPVLRSCPRTDLLPIMMLLIGNRWSWKAGPAGLSELVVTHTHTQHIYTHTNCHTDSDTHIQIQHTYKHTTSHSHTLSQFSHIYSQILPHTTHTVSYTFTNFTNTSTHIVLSLNPVDRHPLSSYDPFNPPPQPTPRLRGHSRDLGACSGPI